MQITKNAVVAFHYKLFEADELLEDSRAEGQQVLYLHGRGGMLDGLQDALEGKSAGDDFSVTLSPEQAYGFRREGAAERIPVKYLVNSKKPRVGDVVQVNTKDGPREVTVTKVGRFNVDVDSNHPFAGKTLKFDVTVEEVREATGEELAHGHAHGAGGHQH